MQPWIAIVISIASLLISAAAFFVSYRGQNEKRHGDISVGLAKSLEKSYALHDKIMAASNSIKTTMKLATEMKESDTKTSVLERGKNASEDAEDLLKSMNQIIAKLRGKDSTKINYQDALYIVQSLELDFVGLSRDLDELDLICSHLLELVKTEMSVASR